MQTRGGERLTYRVHIYFRMLGGFRDQHHTLSVWKSIRELEARIRAAREEISAKNQIDVANEDLVAGVEYTFSIVAVDGAGQWSDPQNLTVTYRGSHSVAFDADGSSSAGDVSFLLFVTNIYDNMPLLAEAVVIFCNPNPDYTVR